MSSEKLCGHSLTGGCHLDECANRHPVDAAAALAEYTRVRTMALCAPYQRTGCADLKCPTMHVALLPLGGAPATPTRPAASVAPSPSAFQIPPSGTTPMRPITSTTAPVTRTVAKESSPPAARRATPAARLPLVAVATHEAASMASIDRAMGRVRSKINAIAKAQEAFQSLATNLKSADARTKAGTATGMLGDIQSGLLALADQLDGYLRVLGTSGDDDG